MKVALAVATCWNVAVAWFFAYNIGGIPGVVMVTTLGVAYYAVKTRGIK